MMTMLMWQEHDEPSTEHGRGWWSVHGSSCEITIERRPSWCDRGNFIAKLHPTGVLARDVDAQDGWPRYYFDFERAKLECEAWLMKRGQMT